MAISTFTLLKSKLLYLLSDVFVNALQTNMNNFYYLTLKKMNKYSNKCIAHGKFMLVNTLTNVDK